MSTATLDGHRVLRASARLPAWGLPFFDVELDDDAELAGRVTLTIADATFVCAVVRGGPWLGRARYLLVGGAGGWITPLPARAYGVSDLGIPRNHVIEDAAAECGETVEGAPTDYCGPAYVRAEGAASAVLHALTPAAWRVDADGVTRFGAPVARAVTPTTRPRVDLAARTVELAEDSIAALVPGVTVEGLVASDVVHTLDSSRLRTTIHAARGGTSERLSLWSALIGALTAELRYAGLFAYRVVYRRGKRLDLQPCFASGGLPQISAVRVRPGVAGWSSTVQLGIEVSVAFLDRDPSRPVVCGFDDAFAPTLIESDAGDELLLSPLELGRVVRYGDTCVFAPIGAPPAPPVMSSGVTYLVAGALPGAPVIASRVKA